MIKKVIAGVGIGLTLGAGQTVHAQVPERLFIQKISTDSAVVRWRGGPATEACVAKSVAAFNGNGKHQGNGKGHARPRCFDAVAQGGAPEAGLGHMEATLTGLKPGTRYFYSVGDQADASQHFNTATAGTPPADGNTRILLVGDSGTITDGLNDEHPEGEHPGEAQAVLDGYNTYAAANGGEDVDLFLALGDNAYVSGTDEEWQKSFFELYADIIKTANTLPTIGNHEMGAGVITLPGGLICALRGLNPCPFEPDALIPLPFGGGSVSSDADSYDGDADLVADGTGLPYLNIFSLPSSGESGGVASGTEQYYSVDYGNVHVVSLDSQVTARDDGLRETMKTWLEHDLAANTLDWTIVIFHHPPYTKGTNHDSDDAEVGLLGTVIDLPERDMRVEFTPVFEQYGVDVVYSGHSHSYERSYYIKGHTGTSDTFSPAAHAELVNSNPEHPASGRGAEAYQQLSPTSGGIDDRVVYTVAGNSGKADSGGDSFGITDDDEWLRHAAHVEQPFSETRCYEPSGCRAELRGLGVKGSVVIDADSNSLTARFVDINGDVLDEFTISR